MTEVQTSTERVGTFFQRRAELLLAAGVLGLMLTLISPLPPALLDILLALNLATAVLLLMVTMNAKRSTELSTFPTILLFATLFRMGLNVASTRLILTGGEAGSIIRAFGAYVGGDNLVVGMIVFLILIIIQFVVITKGSGRISEVAARFVLDAMPGKQMAIDADLNSGLIDSDQARERREAVAKEAEFYGAMDGASKFVRGDAVAGLIITAINLIGGILIGSMGGLAAGEAAQRYGTLTIGDGLVSQIPALFISTAAGVLVTKETSASNLGQTLVEQVGGRPRATIIAAAMIFILGLLPGMPKIPFFVLASVLLVLWRQGQDMEKAAEQAQVEPVTEEVEPSESDEVGGLLRVDRISLEIGYRLIPMVQDGAGGGILDHVSQLRRRFAMQQGVVLPPVRIKDNVKLQPNSYRLLLGGEEIARGEIEPGEFLAMDSGTASGRLKGRETTDPAFGLPATWISASRRDQAELEGYTVIDPTSVLVTHISETLRRSMGDILTRDDVKELVETVKETSPAVVEELIPERMSYGEVQKVLRNLLREEVSIRNVPIILEVLADNVAQTRDSEALTELVRQRLGRAICETHSDEQGTVWAVTLDPGIEGRLATAVGIGDGSPAQPVNPAWLQTVVEQIGQSISAATQGGRDVVLLVRSNVRRFMNELVRASLPKVAVLSYNEVVPARAVETVEVVKVDD